MFSLKQQRGFLSLFSRISSLAYGIPRLFMLVGIIFFIIGCYNLFRAFQTYSWPSVQGRIISSGVESYTTTYTDRATDRLSEQTVYDAYIAYEYIVEGARYSNDTVKVGGTIGSNIKAWTRALLNKYPQGKTVNIYYKPTDPTQSVLEKGIQLSTWFVAVFGLAFFVFGYYFQRAIRNLGRKLFGFTTEQQESSTAEQSKFAKVTDPRLPGKWKVVYQVPSYEELATYSMKQFNLGAENIHSKNVVVPSATTIVTITESQIRFAQQGANLFGKAGQEYTLQGDRLVLAPVKLGGFVKAMASLLPSYYHFSFMGTKLILTSDKIKGCDNRSIVYHLERV
ncbi:Protein of unknown function [Alteromonadaceae bacterium Bs31]|nr:Protein of unknown function [Alteromonadaceae bacterium Bs31]